MIRILLLSCLTFRLLPHAVAVPFGNLFEQFIMRRAPSGPELEGANFPGKLTVMNNVLPPANLEEILP